jgi:hypothetical protein
VDTLRKVIVKPTDDATVDSARSSREIDGEADEAQRTAMSKRMMVALATGERDPEHVKLAASKPRPVARWLQRIRLESDRTGTDRNPGWKRNQAHSAVSFVSNHGRFAEAAALSLKGLTVGRSVARPGSALASGARALSAAQRPSTSGVAIPELVRHPGSLKLLRETSYFSPTSSVGGAPFAFT